MPQTIERLFDRNWWAINWDEQNFDFSRAPQSSVTLFLQPHWPIIILIWFTPFYLHHLLTNDLNTNKIMINITIKIYSFEIDTKADSFFWKPLKLICHNFLSRCNRRRRMDLYTNSTKSSWTLAVNLWRQSIQWTMSPCLHPAMRPGTDPKSATL